MSTTLSTSLILQMVLASFRSKYPMLFGMSTDFRGQASPLKLDTTYTAHIRTKPTSAAYTTANGYKNGATSARTLLVDVPITVNKHRHVPLLWEHLNMIKDHKEDFKGALSDAGYVLGKEMVDSVLRKAVGNAHFTNTVTDSVANSDRDTLAAICELMNTNEADAEGRIGIVQSSVMTSLMGDTEISSSDYYAQRADGTALRVLRNIEGFSAIYEYPSFPQNLSKTFTAEADDDLVTIVGADADTPHEFYTGDMVRVSNSGGGLPTGLSADTTYYAIRVSATTIKLATTDANAVAGTAINITGDGTGTQTIVGYNNTSGVFFERRAMAVLAGVPMDTAELARAMGIPPTMKMDSFTEPSSNLTMALVKWMEANTMNLYASPCSLWGSSLGRQSGVADTITDLAAVRLITA